LLERVEGPAQGVQIVRVGHLHHLPAVAGKPRGHVFAESQLGCPFDSDLVVVVNPTQVRQLEMPGQRGRLVRDAFHHVAVAAQGVGVEIEQGQAGPIVVRRQPPRGDGHTHAIAHPLTERPGRHFHAAGMAVLRMARAAAIQLAEVADIVQRHGRLGGGPPLVVELLHAAQVQHRVEQHRGVTAGEDEAVAARPAGIVGIVPQPLVVEQVGDGGQGHGGARMPALGRLHRIHRQGPNGINR
jgi:hypothetical protein